MSSFETHDHPSKVKKKKKINTNDEPISVNSIAINEIKTYTATEIAAIEAQVDNIIEDVKNEIKKHNGKTNIDRFIITKNNSNVMINVNPKINNILLSKEKKK